MSDPKMPVCPNFGQMNRVRAEAAGVPHCGKSCAQAGVSAAKHLLS